ncbi:DUF1643 domain-containing protein [Phormidium tenue]|uniref:DUF1643 domain-containing protein n=1 Tax=Phormidium tenue FACHB-1050 TaxID=2692857 RepID=A0ABR8CGL0_9CYAN|nr:DUF1643 domain-containing protein [Phormidium tenue]MBD2319872.1 DUF1643 domain-containing protein [Phormidium tenue FACHB-1050]
MKKGAVIDKTGLYRYSLWREWDIDKSKIVFIMLNPSKADASIDDPTLRRCINFANSWGFGSLIVVNLFAFRTASPLELKKVDNPIGKQNDRYLKKAIKSADRVVVAWGNNGKLMQRDRFVLELLSKHNIQPHCLGITKSGYPCHPLYVLFSNHLSVYAGLLSW